MSLTALAKAQAGEPEPDLDFGSPATAHTIPAPDTQPPRVAAPVTSAAPAACEWIEVEAVVGGCLMRLRLRGMGPAEVMPWLRGLDPAVKVRDDFPKSGGGFGKKETKRARLMVITLKASDNGCFIDLVAKGEAEVSVTVSKKRAPEFVGMLAGTQRVTDEHLDKLQGAMDSKGQATVILEGSETVDVEYWLTDDGKAFLEALHGAEPTP